MCLEDVPNGNPEGDGAEEGQLPLDLPVRPPRMTRDDFIVSDANAADLATLDAWLASDAAALAICGAPSSGKTHLAAIAAQSLGADHVYVAEDGGLDHAAGGPAFVIDNLDQLRRPGLLLEAIGKSTQASRRLILVGRGAPAQWAGDLRDLVTRLEAMPRISVSPPDESLLRSVILKLFADRQRRVDPKIAEYAAPRIRRTLDAAARFVDMAEQKAMAKQSAVTVPLAREALAALQD